MTFFFIKGHQIEMTFKSDVYVCVICIIKNSFAFAC